MICATCSASNAAEAIVCGGCGAKLPPATVVQAQIAPAHVFQDPQALKTLVLVALACLALLLLISIYFDISEIGLIKDIKSGVFNSEDELMAAAAANDSRQRILGFVFLAVFAATVLVFAIWIYRVAQNARALGAAGFTITPGWAVGWYFLPIANLWMPYKAMSEIWRASRNPAGWQADRAGEFLGWWWAMWVVSYLVGNASGQFTMSARELDEMSRAAQLRLVSELLSGISIVVSARLVILLSNCQTRQATMPADPAV